MPLRRPRLRPLLLSLVLLALTGALAAQGAAPLTDTIRLEDLRADLFFLAGDGFRGRLVGTPENALAADWVRSRFERAGLRPGAPDGTFVQPTQLMVATLGEGNALHVHRSETDGQSFRPMYDFYPQRFSASASTTARVAYAGFGITARALNYDDYGDRVRGRIALILDHEPGAAGERQLLPEHRRGAGQPQAEGVLMPGRGRRDFADRLDVRPLRAARGRLVPRIGGLGDEAAGGADGGQPRGGGETRVRDGRHGRVQIREELKAPVGAGL